MKNFFNISDLSSEIIYQIINLKTKNNILENKNIGLIFEKESTRTRLSFKVGINQLSGNSIDINFTELNINRYESFEDTFRAMNCYLDGLIFRTNFHDKLNKAANFFKKPIINALSEISHPCQALSDFFTLREYFGNSNLNILWIGDMNNVCFSFNEIVNLIEDLEFNICCPKKISENLNWEFCSRVNIVENLNDIDLSKIDCVMTDVFISMNDSNDDYKEDLLKPYQVTNNLMSKTKPNSIFMHCLPAKVGYEVSEEVLKSPKSIIWKQAYNRMVVQKKLLQFIYQ